VRKKQKKKCERLQVKTSFNQANMDVAAKRLLDEFWNKNKRNKLQIFLWR